MGDAHGAGWLTLLRPVERVDSTMRLARRLAESGAAEGTCVVARQQWGGRGRRGRRWESPAGAGLALTCILRPPPGRAVAELALVAGAVVWRAARLLGARHVRLKWPNDVVLPDGRKLAGILVEGEPGVALVGIGLNLAPAREIRASSPAPLCGRYVGLRELAAGLPVGEAGRQAALEVVVPALGRAYAAWLAEGLRQVRRTWPQADALGRAEVAAVGRAGPVRGRAAGLAADGRLRLVTAEGEHLIEAGEVHALRRVPRPSRRAPAVGDSDLAG